MNYGLRKTEGSLRTAADLLFHAARRLTGGEPEKFEGWYKIGAEKSGFAWIRFIGDQARRYPPQSIHLVVKNDPFHDQDQRFQRGNDWWGKPDNHVVGRATMGNEVALALELMCRAFWLVESQR